MCDEIGAFMSVAHPFRHFFDPVTFRRKGEEPFSMSPEEAAEKMRVFQVVHGIEVGNGGNTRRENIFALEVAQILNKPVTGGSDAHSTSGIGTYTTVFPEPLTCREQTVQLPARRRDSLLRRAQPQSISPVREVRGGLRPKPADRARRLDSPA